MSIKGAYLAGQAFASEHLRELAEEVVEWRNTGILRDGKMRELANITRELNAADALGIAEAYVVAKALELASQADVARDAERYRWLRSQADESEVFGGHFGTQWLEVPPRKAGDPPRHKDECVNDAFDAAMAAQRGEAE